MNNDLCKDCQYLKVCEALHEDRTENVIFTSACFKFNNFSASEIFKEQIQVFKFATLKNLDDVIEFGKTVGIEITSDNSGGILKRELSSSSPEGNELLADNLKPMAMTAVKIIEKLEEHLAEILESDGITFKHLSLNVQNGKMFFDFDCSIPVNEPSATGEVIMKVIQGNKESFQKLDFQMNLKPSTRNNEDEDY